VFDWNDLKYFIAIARSGSTLAAARTLRLSQSTVHRRIEELEKQLGGQLVTRHPTGYRLTELGEKLRSYAERVEQTVTDFERQASAWGKDARGTVKVTCPDEVGSRLLASGLIDKFNERYPALRVEFVMSDKNLDLAKGQADIAIRAVPPTDDTLFGRKIGNSSWAVYASKSYVKRYGGVKRLEDIDHHSVVLFDGKMRDHRSARWLQSVAPNARIAARANNMLAMQLAVKSGAGLAPMPVIIGEKDKALVRVFGPVQDITTPFFLLMHGDMKRTPRVRAFFDFMIDELPHVRPLLSGKLTGPRGRKLRNLKT
jgi:DNA-binding transcriptional LysR family regulator